MRNVEVKIIVQPAFTSEASFQETVNVALENILEEHSDAIINVSIAADNYGRLSACIQYEYKEQI